jgi:DnaB helicase-like protein/AAA domain-containing protein
MSTVPFTRNRNAPLPVDLAKKMPSNLDAERSVLGAILLDNRGIIKVAGYLHVDEFFLDQHRRIFDAMLELAKTEVAAGGQLTQSIDLVTLTEALNSSGQLEAAGGAPYLASLADGMPRVSNIKHYATIVIEKARLRKLIHATHNIQQRAFEGEDGADAIISNAEQQIKQFTTTNGDNPAVVLGFKSLLARKCAPVEYAIEPLLSSRGTGEIFSWRGTGKSYITTQMAVDIAKGRPMMFGGHRGGGGHWPISRAYRLLYVYGEMDDTEIQLRSIALAKMCGGDIPEDQQLGTMCKDYQPNWRPKISTARDRKFIEDRIFGYGYEGLILDNISTLWPTSQENQSDRSAILAEWFNDLNQRGIWVIFLHHAGKSGEQRGDSEKEDMLSFVLKLRRPANYKPEQGLRVEVHVDKNRYKPKESRWLMPFEIQLLRNEHGEQEWVTRPARDAQKEAAFAMFKDKMPTMLVAQEVGVSKATIYRWYAEYDENPNVDFHRSSFDD